MARRPLLHPGLAGPLVLSLAASLGSLCAPASAAAQEAPAVRAEDANSLTYVVNARAGGRTADQVRREIAAAGAHVVAAYEEIGVLVVSSAKPGFGTRLRALPGVQSAGATHTAPLSPAGTDRPGAVRRLSETEAHRIEGALGGGAEPLEAEQWDLRAIGADKAARINPGSPDVTVAVIDTGVDDTHPDLAPNFSPAQSANCATGTADTTYGSWRPANAAHFHGTHVAGTIAAARNGTGIAGVAPGVKVSAITVSQPTPRQLIFAESVVCAFVFAADHGVQIANNSYYVDPWQYACLDDPDQKAIVDALARAQLYARRKGTLTIAGAGNAGHDLAAGSFTDTTSPNDSTPVERTVDPRRCWDLPAQLPGVVAVSATGARNTKAYYSNFGLGVIDVAAPGGDQYQSSDTPSGSGGILSTMPGGQYGYEQGTSMATPHAAAVAALLKSAHPHAGPEQLEAMLKAQADNPGCPATSRTGDPTNSASGASGGSGTGVGSAADGECAGGRRVNGFYGFGIVNALRAVE